MPGLYPHALTAHFTRAEFQQVHDEAERRGISVETFLRNVVLAATPPRPWTSSQLRAIQAEAAATGHIWNLAELLQRQLPLFWNEEWVREQLSQGRSPAEIAELAGGWPVRSAHNYILNLYGIRLTYPRLDAQTVNYIREQVALGRSRLEVADEIRSSRFVIDYHSKNTKSERERRFEKKSESVNRWPATTKEIADAIFSGNGNRASSWCRDMVKSGRLIRVRHGFYDKRQCS